MALGQYNLYRGLLAVTAPERRLYLAVSDLVYDKFLAGTAMQLVIQQQQPSLLLVNIQTEEVAKWID